LNMQGAGSSFNTDTIKKKLQLKGDFKVANAVLKTINIAQMASGAISGVIAKIPVLSGKKVNVPANKESRYELISSNFTMANGMIDAPNFVGKADVHGVDIKGSTKMGLIDESLDAKWELVDTHRVLSAEYNVPNPMGGTINNILAKAEKDPIILPITVGCKWTAPCPNYASSVEYLAGVAAGRLAKGLGEGAKAKATSAVQGALQKVIGGGGGNPLKKLFGH
jgi:hypothetical protein